MQPVHTKLSGGIDTHPTPMSLHSESNARAIASAQGERADTFDEVFIDEDGWTYCAEPHGPEFWIVTVCDETGGFVGVL